MGGGEFLWPFAPFAVVCIALHRFAPVCKGLTVLGVSRPGDYFRAGDTPLALLTLHARHAIIYAWHAHFRSSPNIRAAHLSEDHMKCSQCQKEFQPRRAWQHFCSANCRNLHHGRVRGEGQMLRARIQELEEELRKLRGEN